MALAVQSLLSFAFFPFYYRLILRNVLLMCVCDQLCTRASSTGFVSLMRHGCFRRIKRLTALIVRMISPYATIVDCPEFHAALSAEKIDRALRAGDKDAVVKVITSISNNQRQQVALRHPA